MVIHGFLLLYNFKISSPQRQTVSVNMLIFVNTALIKPPDSHGHSSDHEPQVFIYRSVTSAVILPYVVYVSNSLASQSPSDVKKLS